MAIAGAMLRSPENLSELLWVARRILGHNTGALDKGLSACIMVLLIRREGCGDRRMSCPEPPSFLDCNNLALLESGPPHRRSRYGHKIQLAGCQSSDTPIFPQVARLQPLPHVIASQKTSEPTHLVCSLSVCWKAPLSPVVKPLAALTCFQEHPDVHGAAAQTVTSTSFFLAMRMICKIASRV